MKISMYGCLKNPYPTPQMQFCYCTRLANETAEYVDYDKWGQPVNGTQVPCGDATVALMGEVLDKSYTGRAVW